jgi:hypothetical protein
MFINARKAAISAAFEAVGLCTLFAVDGVLQNQHFFNDAKIHFRTAILQ